MSDAAAYLAAAVLFGLVGYRMLADRRSGLYTPRAALYGFLLCLGLAMVLLSPATSDLLGRLGVGALYVVLAGEIVRTAAVSFLMLVGHTLAPRPAPAHLLPTALLIQAAMTGTLLAAHPATTADWSLRVSGAGRWLLSGHDALFGGYAIWCLAVVTAALAREARRAGPGPLRLGLRLTLAAAVVGILWAAWTADDIADVLRSGVQNGSEDALSNVLGAVCAALVVAGTTVARWGTALTAPLRWLRTYRTYARLGPLWRELRAELPQIALADRPRGLNAARPAGAEFALYRRVIEIHDGRLALRPYAHPRSAVAAALAPFAAGDAGESGGRPGDEAGDEAGEAWPFLVEAVSIAAALANLRAGRRLEDPDAESAEAEPSDSPAAEAPNAQVEAPASGAVEAEAAWLLRVTEELTGSPAVRPALRRLENS